MRVLIQLLTGVSTLCATGLASASEWHHGDFDDALSEAMEYDGEILLDVYTTWCGPCRRLAEEVFPTVQFIEAADGMVLAKVDAESEAGAEVARRYAVVGYPTVLVLDSRGNELGRIFGFLDADDFSATLREIRFGVPTLTEFFEVYARVARAEETFSVAFESGFEAASCGHYDTADRLLETLVRLDSDNSTGFASSALLVLGKYRYLRGSNDPDTAITYFDRIIEEFPESSEYESAIVQSGIAHARAGRDAQSIESFERYLSIEPTDAGRANSVAFSMVLESVDLERARAIAEQALESTPDDDSLWNTLAEVHFALSNREAALSAIDRAIELNDNGYYREQRARFESE